MGRAEAPPLVRAGRNLVLKTVGEVGGRVFFALLFIYAARLLGPDDFGRYTYAASLSALALIGMDLGLNTLFVRDGARNRSEIPAYAGTLLVVKLCLACLVLAVIWGYCLLIGLGENDTALVMTVALAQALWGFCELAVAGLNAMERMDREALVRNLGRFTALILAGGLLLSGLGVWGLAVGLALANALAAGLALYILGRLSGFRPRLKADFLGRLFREGLPLAMASMFILVYVRIDMVMLEAMGRPMQEIGWYGAAVKLIDAVGMAPALAAGALLPVISSLTSDRREEAVKLFRQGQRLLMLLGLPAAVGLLLLRNQVSLFLYGPEFSGTPRAFAWLAPMLAVFFLNHLQLAMLTALGRQNAVARATGLCALLNVALNLALIPGYGFVGAAAATLVTEALLCGQCAITLRSEIGRGSPVKGLWQALASTGVMALLLYFIGSWPLFAVLPLGVAAYTASLALMGGLPWREIKKLLTGACGKTHKI